MQFRFVVCLSMFALAGCGPAGDPAQRSAPDTQATATAGALDESARELLITLDDLPLRLPQPMRLRGTLTSLESVPAERARLRGWLLDGAHAELAAALARLRADARASGSDREFAAVFDGLGDPDRTLEVALDRWVARAPDDAYALTARGRHWLARGGQARGTRSGADTSDERLKAMRGALERARDDLVAAVERDPTLTLAHAGLVELERHHSSRRAALELGLIGAIVAIAEGRDRAEFRRQRAERVLAAAAAHPHSYAVQVAAMHALQPKWGGDVDALLKLAGAAPIRAGHPDFTLLRSLSACLLADELRIRRERELAIDLFASIEARYRDTLHPSCLMWRGLTELSSGRAEAAERSLREFLLLEPSSRHMPAWLAHALLRQDRRDEAASVLDAALLQHPASPGLLCLRALLDTASGELDRALQRTTAALAQNPLDDACWMRSSDVLNRLGRPAEAALAAERAAQLAADNAAALREHGIALTMQDRHVEAIAKLDAAIALDGEDASSWFWRGSALRRLERARDAMDSFSRAIELSPSQAASWYERGVVRAYLLRDVEGAEADLLRATEQGPDLVQAWFELAGVRYRRRDCEFVPALRTFVQGCERHACDADRLGWAQGKLGDPGLGRLCPGQ
jgi:tetratricopeptide (TPR) repeat protein